jgi:8-oxo-dGTP pyrophosphatase MutT (NUDIX family)
MMSVQPVAVKKKYCTNCGELTHPVKECKQPIMSCGIILYQRYQDNSIEYLMICRRNSIGFVELVRGRYDVSNVAYIRSNVYVMSRAEVEYMKCMTFDELWNIVWLDQAENFQKEKKTAEEKFNLIRPFLMKCIDEYTLPYEDPEWGFPKGRRNYKESHRMAAIRELKEETSISPHFYALHTEPMFEEEYVSYDGKRYKNIYFLGCLREHFRFENLPMPMANSIYHYETSQIKMLTVDECIMHIRPYNTEKRSMIAEIDHYLKNSDILRSFHQNRVRRNNKYGSPVAYTT